MCDNIASDFEEGIHFTDFIAATFDKNVYLTKERLRTIFNYFDIFNKGYLTS
jgi:Ca2+-binding EF-hand superfamily protein